jgi:hypothetical protein
VTQLGQHPTDLAILPFGKDEFEDGRIASLTDRLDPLRADLSFGQPDPLGQLREHLAGRRTSDDHPVKLFNAVFRVSQLVGEFTVVGQEQQTDAHLVEPTDRVDALRDLGQEIENPGSSRRVIVGRDVALGLVDSEVDRALDLDLLAIERDRGFGEVDLRPQLANDLAIDGDSPLENQLLAGPSRADPGMGENFLEPLGSDQLAGTLGRSWPRRHRRLPGWRSWSRWRV